MHMKNRNRLILYIMVVFSNENGTHWLIPSNACSSVSGAVWKGLGDMPLLKELCHNIPSSLSLCLKLMCQYVSSQLLQLPGLLSWCCASHHDDHDFTQWNSKPQINYFFYNLLWSWHIFTATESWLRQKWYQEWYIAVAKLTLEESEKYRKYALEKQLNRVIRAYWVILIGISMTIELRTKWAWRSAGKPKKPFIMWSCEKETWIALKT